MRILITNVYSYKNKGDAAIVLALLGEVNRAFNRAVISVQTTDIEGDDGKYGVPTKPTLLYLVLTQGRRKGALMGGIHIVWSLIQVVLFLSIARWLNKKAYWMLDANLKGFMRDTSETDLTIACGGGYLRSTNTGVADLLILLVTCMNILASYYLKKPVYLYSQSIGPVHGRLQTAILKHTLKRVSLIEAREDISSKYVRSLGFNETLIETTDPVFTLYRERQSTPNLSAHGFKVGLTVRKWFANPSDYDKYLSTIAELIDHLFSTYNATVTYIPQVIASDFGDDDRVAARLVLDKVKNKAGFVVNDADLSVEEIIKLCGTMDVFVGTRMHSNIFALINTVPVVAIEYEYKTRGIMRSLGLEDYVLEISKLDYKGLADLVDKIIDDRQNYRARIATALPGVVTRSQSAIDAIKTDYMSRA